MRYFVPFTRTESNETDEYTYVEGYAATESVGMDGLIIDRAAMKSALPDYFAHGTGALREMHLPNAAGYVDGADVDGEGRTWISGKVFDPVARMKVRAGVYKGFSIGAKDVRRVAGDSKRISALRLVEISLVDRPVDPGAELTMWRTEEAFDVEDETVPAEAEDIERAAETDTNDRETAPKGPKSKMDKDIDAAVERREFSDAERKKDAKSGAAMRDGSFPIENKQDLHNAMKAVGRANPSKRDAVRRHIRARAKALGLESELSDSYRAEDADGRPDFSEEDGVKRAGAMNKTNPHPGADRRQNEIDLSPPARQAVRDSKKAADELVVSPEFDEKSVNTAEVSPASPALVTEGNKAVDKDVKGPRVRELDDEVAAREPLPSELEQEEREVDLDAEAAASGEKPITRAEEIIARMERELAEARAELARAAQVAAHPRAEPVPPILSKTLKGAELRRGICAVSNLGYLLQELAYAIQAYDMEGAIEGDDGVASPALRAALKSLAAAFKTMSAEEADELLEDVDVDVVLAQAAIAASRITALEDDDALQRTETVRSTILPALDRLGLVPQPSLPVIGGKTYSVEELERTVSSNDALCRAMVVMSDGISSLRADISEMAAGAKEREELHRTEIVHLQSDLETRGEEIRRLSEVAQQPRTVATPAGLAAVSKAAEANGGATVDNQGLDTNEDIIKRLASMSQEEQTLALIRATHLQPRIPGRV